MCKVPFCRKEPTMVYYGFDVCEACFIKHCDMEDPNFDLKKIFRIEEDRK